MKIGKEYYFVGAVLISAVAYLLYDKIKKGNTNLIKNDYSFTQAEEGSHLQPPMTVPTLATPPLNI
jgi:hypothetical protein